ncbi:50S ribosomal protein L25/general stress protein Ctc [Lichenifustis flavocetrariae]|uniref:Large ribosomal subunit protein bL25 n=1 Tax=Lichenifustis flavocetrariae TaxID=2949735 RepID=A0AA41Z0F4_9HYPH|nr:50S ribosomal protein L25/general stress protein Ctc [Lichenifustis flavocetrariae]MCW6507032.1 50S ribosomal protein L25/general stress protein Ctc [Lichenifustis flavocetrariae]
MAAMKTLAAAVRSGTGKGAARSVRRGGRVPGVIYGGGEAPEPISLEYNEAHKLIYAGHFLTTIFELDIEGRKERVIPRDYQLDVVKDTPMHVDFLRLRAGSKLKVAVPVHFINGDTAPGIKLGGTLNVVQHAIEMMVPADNIPDSLTVDLAGVEIGDSIHISAIALPEGCKPTIRDRDFTVVTVVAPTTMTEEPGTPAALAAEAAAAAAATGGKGAPAKGGAAKGATAAAAKPAAGAKPAAAAKPAAKK